MSEKLSPCPFCNDHMENRGYGAIHIDGKGCPIGSSAFDVEKWNRRFGMVAQFLAENPVPQLGGAPEDLRNTLCAVLEHFDIEGTLKVTSYALKHRGVNAFNGKPITEGWRTIESAPKDGTHIDLWMFWPNQGLWDRRANAFWNGEAWQLGEYAENQYTHPPTITHWMTPPAGPSSVLDPKGARS